MQTPRKSNTSLAQGILLAAGEPADMRRIRCRRTTESANLNQILDRDALLHIQHIDVKLICLASTTNFGAQSSIARSPRPETNFKTCLDHELSPPPEKIGESTLPLSGRPPLDYHCSSSTLRLALSLRTRQRLHTDARALPQQL
jgi:hypothetical protein